MSEPEDAPLTPSQRALAESVPGLVRDRVAWYLRRRPWAHHIASDLAGVGWLAVEEAARSYSAKHGALFSTWARSNVDWALLAALRHEARHQHLRDATAVAAQWGTVACAMPDDEKLRADRDDEDVAAVKLRGALKAKFTAAAFALSTEREELEQSLNPEKLVTRRPLTLAVRALRAKLPERQQKLLACVYDRGMKLADAAAELGLAHPTVKVLHAKLLRDLYVQLADLGLTDPG